MHRTAAKESNSEATVCLGDPRGLDPGFGNTEGPGPHLALLLGPWCGSDLWQIIAVRRPQSPYLNVDIGLKVTKDACFFSCWL